jgi:tetratricopeptide (TPR) repeat protein
MSLKTAISLACAALLALAPSAPGADAVEADRKDADALIEEGWSELQKRLDDVQSKLDSMMQEAAGGPNGLENVPDEFKGMLDASPMKEKLRALQEASARISYTNDDLAAIEAYVLGEYDRAEDILERTAVEEPRRVMPPFAFACLRFEQRRFEDAAALFAQVLELQPESATALLLKGMSERLAGNPSPTPEKLLEAYDYAYAECVTPAPKEDFGLNFAMMLASATTSPLTYDPVLMRFKELTVPACLKFMMRLLREYEAGQDINRKVALAFVIGPPLGWNLIENLSAAHPDDIGLKTQSLLCELTEFWKENFSASLPERTVGDLRALNPENGAFMLMAIKEVEEEEGPYDAPLNEAELRLYEQGVTAAAFDTHVQEPLALLIRLYPGVWDKLHRPGFLIGGVAISKATHATWRAKTAAEQELAGGRDTEALRIIALIRQFADRAGSREEALSPLIADSIVRTADSVLIKHAIETAQKEWPASVVDEVVAFLREMALSELSIHNLNGFMELPVRTLDGAGDFGDGKWAYDRARRMMALYGEDFAEEAFSELSESYDIYGGHEYVKDSLFPQEQMSKNIIKLEMLGRREALPLLEQIAQQDWPLAAYVAREAIRSITETNPAPAVGP